LSRGSAVVLCAGSARRHGDEGAPYFDLRVSTRGAGGSGPAVRMLRVPGSLTLDDLHLCIAVAFDRGMEPPHRYVFEWGDRRLLRIDPLDPALDADDERLADAEFVRLDELGLRTGAHLRYVYDFAAFRVHDVAVEAVRAGHRPDVRPRCLEASGSAVAGGASPDLERVNRALGAIFASLAAPED
jgi:hypothetical protein